jgi:hypothetical protein
VSYVRGVGLQRLPLRHVRHTLHELRPPLSTAVLASRSKAPPSPFPAEGWHAAVRTPLRDLHVYTCDMRVVHAVVLSRAVLCRPRVRGAFSTDCELRAGLCEDGAGALWCML